MDGKRVVLQSPINSGSEYFNYKSTFSIVLFAVVDANYNFLYANAGCQGRISDGGVFKQSQLYKKLEQNLLCFPQAEPLKGRQTDVPYFFIGDEAFALSENLMKPFPGMHSKGSLKRVYNYRLCRARVFRVLRKSLLLEPEKARLIVMTVVHLQNFLRSCNSMNMYTPPGTFDTEVDGHIIEGSWRRTASDEETTSFLLLRNVPRKSCKSAQEIREELSQYFQTENRLEWQDEYA